MAEDEKKDVPKPAPPKKVEDGIDNKQVPEATKVEKVVGDILRKDVSQPIEPVVDEMDASLLARSESQEDLKQIASAPDILTTDHLSSIENVAERTDIEAIKTTPNVDLVDLEGSQLSAWQAQNSADKFLIKAKRVVIDYMNSTSQTAKRLQLKELNIVWFSKTLQNWKALISTVHKDGLYFEVTYNGHLGETYVDVYQKLTNVIVED